MPLRRLNDLQDIKNTVFMAKALYQFITHLFFLANIPKTGRVYYQLEKNSHPVAFEAGRLALWRDIYP